MTDVNRDEQRRIIGQIQSTFDFMGVDPAAGAALRPWLEWQAEEMVNSLHTGHFTDSELMALVGLTGPIFARIRTRPADTKVPPALRAV